MNQEYEIWPDLHYRISFSQPGARGTITSMYNPNDMAFEMNLDKSSFEFDDIRIVSNRTLNGENMMNYLENEDTVKGTTGFWYGENTITRFYNSKQDVIQRDDW